MKPEIIGRNEAVRRMLAKQHEQDMLAWEPPASLREYCTRQARRWRRSRIARTWGLTVLCAILWLEVVMMLSWIRS